LADPPELQAAGKAGANLLNALRAIRHPRKKISGHTAGL